MMQAARGASAPDWSAQGDALLRIGDLAAAETAYRHALTLEDRDAHAWRRLSAILRRRGERAQARALLVHAARLCPVERRGTVSAGRPQLLRPRSIDAADYCAVRRRDGGFKTKYKGGHFSTENLLAGTDCDMVIANLVGDDAAPLYAAPPADLFLNTVACPDRGRAALDAIARYLADRPDLPVINHPAAVARTGRDDNWVRLREIDGAIFPRTVCLNSEVPLSRRRDAIAASGSRSR